MNNNDDLDFSHLIMSPDEVNLVIYHDPCSDGFGSALASYIKFKDNNGMNKFGDKVQYYPTNYGKPAPDVKGKNVLICDFSYKNDVMHKLLEESNKLVILDHHKTAHAELDGYTKSIKIDGKMVDIEQKEIPQQNKVFRMNYSGAYITWRYFFGDNNVPDLIRYIQDNDIWTKALPNTRDVTAYIYSLPFEFEAYAKLLEPNGITNIIPIGQAINKQNDLYIKQALDHATPRFVQIKNNYYFGIFCNSTVLKSDVGNQAFNVYPYADFSAIYSDVGYFSLRSTDDRMDVSEIASFYGGGGHRNASGLIHNQNILGRLLDDYHLYNILTNIYFDTLSLNDTTHNVVYLNCTHNRQHIGKYLLQTKYQETYETTKRPVQECCSIQRVRSSDNTFYKQYDIAIIWNYDGNKNVTWYTLLWSNNELLEKINNNFKDYDNYLNKNNRVVFSKNGLNNLIQ